MPTKVNCLEKRWCLTDKKERAHKAYVPFTTNLPLRVVTKLAETTRAATSSRQRGMMNMKDYKVKNGAPEQNEKF